MYETFEHTADLGLRVSAPDFESLFAEAGRGLFSMLVENLDDVQPLQSVEFEVPGAEIDYLFFDWLTELLYCYESRRLLLCKFRVSRDEQGIRAVASGEPVDPKRHSLTHEVKAITYHQLEVQQTAECWSAEVIVDI
jgi:SHS2 domain-containing protein